MLWRSAPEANSTVAPRRSAVDPQADVAAARSRIAIRAESTAYSIHVEFRVHDQSSPPKPASCLAELGSPSGFECTTPHRTTPYTQPPGLTQFRSSSLLSTGAGAGGTGMGPRQAPRGGAERWSWSLPEGPCSFRLLQAP